MISCMPSIGLGPEASVTKVQMRFLLSWRSYGKEGEPINNCIYLKWVHVVIISRKEIKSDVGESNWGGSRWLLKLGCHGAASHEKEI